MKHKVAISLLLMLGLCGVSYAQALKCDTKEVQKKLLELGDEIVDEYKLDLKYLNAPQDILGNMGEYKEYYDLLKEEPQNRVIDFKDFKIYRTKSSAAKKDGTQLLCKVKTTLYHKDQPEKKPTRDIKYTINKTKEGIEVKVGLPLFVH